MIKKEFVYKLMLPLKDRIQSKKFLNYYAGEKNAEESEVYNYVKKTRKLRALNYKFVEKYDSMIIDVYWDKIEKMFYVIHNNRRMYFAKRYDSKGKVLDCYRLILMEQDIESPHRYLVEGFQINGGIVLDGGVAEGNFSIDLIDRVEKMILIECDSEWVDALNITFKKEISEGKVVIIQKFLSDKDDENNITIDEISRIYGEIRLIKLDIEGFEQQALMGGKTTMNTNKNMELLVCTYHTEKAYEEICQLLKDNFECSTTNGYMVMNPWFGWKPPYLRRGLVRAVHK